MAHDWLADLADVEHVDRHGHWRLRQAARSEVGAFCDDLVERILRGDLHHRRKVD
jgi:hypothetical protein